MKELIINSNDLEFNINTIKNKETSKDYTIIAVIKGNGYGLGIVQYANFLINHDIKFLAVAGIEEALQVRNAKIKEKLIILTPYTNKKDVESLIENDVILTIDSAESAKIANEIAKEKNKTITAHIKIDTRIIALWL